MNTTTADATNLSQGTESTEAGQAQASDTEGGESAQKGSGKGEPGAEGLFDGMDAPTLHKSYKSLQREYTRIQNDIVKKFDPFGGADQVLQWTQYLVGNPDFASWVAAQKSKNELGIDESTLDEPTKAALATVRKVAKAVVAEEVGRVRQEMEPISEAQKEELLSRHFGDMDEKYGDSWQEMRDMMSDLSEELPEKVQDHPKFEDVEDLYFKALRKSGKLDAYAANQHAKKLAEKKKLSTTGGKPTTSAEGQPARAKSIAEAFLQAKQQTTQ